jgi:hypothetical protein
MMKATNTKMLRTMVEAMEKVAPGLSFIAVQTGSNVSVKEAYNKFRHFACLGTTLTANTF